MALKRKHLDALRLANLTFTEEFVENNPRFIGVDTGDIVDLVEFLHKQYPEDAPVIPLKVYADRYLIYIHDN